MFFGSPTPAGYSFPFPHCSLKNAFYSWIYLSSVRFLEGNAEQHVYMHWPAGMKGMDFHKHDARSAFNYWPKQQARLHFSTFISYLEAEWCMMVNKALFRCRFIWCVDKDFQPLSQEVKKASTINTLFQKTEHLISFSLDSEVRNYKDEFHVCLSKLCAMEID